MKNYIFLSVFIIFSTFQGISQTANPLSITVEDIDMTMLSKAEQAKWKTKIQKFSQPTFADDCTPEQQTFNRRV